MLAKEVKRGEIVRKVFELTDVKDYSIKDPETGDTIKRLKFFITSNRKDRDKDVVDPAGIMTDDYANNPVMLWAHQYDQLPIARAVEMERLKEAGVNKDGDTVINHKISALVTFQPDSNYQKNWSGLTGGMVYDMYSSKLLNAVSIGFDPHEWEALEEKDVEKTPSTLLDMIDGGGTKFLKWDMLEFSAVPVPSNPDALVDRKTRKSFMKTLKTWADETVVRCEACKQEVTQEPVEDDTMEKSITDSDKSSLMAAIGKESLQDLSAYHRRLHQFSAQGNLMTGFTKADMNWLHAQVETAMCAWHKKDVPPTKCADPSPLEWKAGTASYTQLVEKCAYITAITEQIREREENKSTEGVGMEKTDEKIEAMSKDELLAHVKEIYKAGRVLSAANESDLRDAVSAHNSGVKLVNGVLNQVTGKPGGTPEQAPGDASDQDQETAANASGTKPGKGIADEVATAVIDTLIERGIIKSEDVIPVVDTGEPVEPDQDEKYLVDEDVLNEALEHFGLEAEQSDQAETN
jgi:hypothetical protein